MIPLRMLLTIAITCAVSLASCARTSPPNILLVVLDTVRSDCTGVVEGRGSITPNLDEIARRGTTFANTTAPAPWTVPSHASLFTGLYRFRHSADHEHFTLDPALGTLAEVLRSHGYTTVGVNCNPWLHRQSGFAQGFDIYEDIYRDVEGEHDKGGKLATAKALEWISRLCKEKKQFFMFVNLMEAHLPYSPPGPTLNRMKSAGFDYAFDSFSVARAESVIAGTYDPDPEELLTIRNLYLGEIAYLDEKVGELLSLLERLDCAGNTVIIMTSDHGEHLGEHALMGHEFSVFGPVLRIPLILSYPPLFPAGTTARAPVSLIDLYPTILSITGIEKEPSPQNAKSLLTSLNLGQDPDRAILSEYSRPTTLIQKYWRSRYPDKDMSGFERSLRALHRGRYKYITTDRGEDYLFDLAEDQAEQHDLSDSLPAVVRDMREALEEIE
jgi:arylsulfatase A-like enzyme